jgi:hypothetical protein
MKASVLYRITSVLLIAAAAGNTYGAWRFWQVTESLNPAHFPSGHRPLTYAQVVIVLELFCSLCVLFGAYLAWHLGTVARTFPGAIGALGWLLFAYQLVGVLISSYFLSGLVFAFSVGIAICIGCAAWLSTGAKPASAAAR